MNSVGRVVLHHSLMIVVIILISVFIDTVAIVVSGPIAKEISDDYSISPKRTASLLDIFTSTCQGLIPYGAQLLIASNMSGITPIDIMPYLRYN